MNHVPDKTSDYSKPLLLCHALVLNVSECLRTEDRHRADDTSRKWKSPRHNTTRIDQRLERAPLDLRAQRIEQKIAGLGNAACDYDDVRIQNVDQIRNSNPEKVRCVTDHLCRHYIASFRSLEYDLRGDATCVALDHLEKNRIPIHFELLSRALSDRRAGRICLEASIVAAFASSSGGIDRRVSDLSSSIGRPVIQFSVENQSATDAGADR